MHLITKLLKAFVSQQYQFILKQELVFKVDYLIYYTNVRYVVLQIARAALQYIKSSKLNGNFANEVFLFVHKICNRKLKLKHVKLSVSRILKCKMRLLSMMNTSSN